jgi:hypothetical protein
MNWLKLPISNSTSNGTEDEKKSRARFQFWFLGRQMLSFMLTGIRGVRMTVNIVLEVMKRGRGQHGSAELLM